MALHAKPSEDVPQKDAGRPFETWWENYRDPRYQNKVMGPLGTKCREAAGDLIEDLLGETQIPQAEMTAFARVLTCLIHDSYQRDGWDAETD